MPIYEYYCEQCNTVYKFLSKKVATEKIPDCPKCQAVKLKRQMSLFATISNKKEGDMDRDMPPVDEAKMEKAISMLASEAEGLNADDPREAASLMRKLSDAAGLKMGAGMEEALGRLEGGEDPEKIEREIEDILKGEDPFTFEGKGKKGTAKKKPNVDETLYEL